MTEIEAARRALAAVPDLAGLAARARIIRLGGLTNRVYRVETADADLCLRIPGEGTAAIIDRHVEAVNARLAASAGLSPPLLHFSDDGVMVTRFLGGAVALSPEGLRGTAGALERSGQALARLHRSGLPFAGHFEVFGTSDRYLALLQRRGEDGSGELGRLVAAAAPIRAALARIAELRPCHCDPTGANLLDTDDRVLLIDWEYSGMNDPFWDLAYLSLQAGLDADADARLAAAYGRDDPGALARIAVTKAACELMSALWALVQASGGNAVADFRGYASRTFNAYSERIGSAAFARALGRIETGRDKPRPA